MIVMMYIEPGSLKHQLSELANQTWSMKSEHLYSISSGLSTIHNLNLIHRDLHNGNILSMGISTFIVDLGLSRPTFQSTYDKNGIYGIMPYIAPEVLKGQPYSQVSDVYSLGVIMSELTTGCPAYHNQEHGLGLSYSICEGHRPEFANGTPQKYIDLANQCMNADASKRPTATQL
ncbi:kinase-like domain-containing protein, partial [Gigaspora rosea]